jgi:chromosome segregation ATPase
MATSEAPEGASCNCATEAQVIQVKFGKRLEEHGRAIGALERGQRRHYAKLETIEGDVKSIASSVGSLSESYGQVIAMSARIEKKVDTLASATGDLFSTVTEVKQDLESHKGRCKKQHTDLDDRLESIVDDPYDVDTAVFEKLTGSEVKDMVAVERQARENLEAQVRDMQTQAKIHQAEKDAVAAAKKRWEDEVKKSEEEQAKTKVARYSMYGTIGVAIIAAAASITVAVISALNG